MTRATTGLVASAVCSAVGLWGAPAAAAIGPVRRLLTPRLAGRGDPGHVALTFDDGPERLSTPRFLEELDGLGVRATFFVLGARVARSPDLARDIVAGGHELGVHGWDHRCVALRGPGAAVADLVRARDLITSTTGVAPRWYRPAYGVATFPVLRAAVRVGLSPVLWTDWGRDWVTGATPASVAGTAVGHLRGGAVLLLHDAPAGRAGSDAWRVTLEALPAIVAHCRASALAVGPLREHGVRQSRGRDRRPPPSMI